VRRTICHGVLLVRNKSQPGRGMLLRISPHSPPSTWRPRFLQPPTVELACCTPACCRNTLCQITRPYSPAEIQPTSWPAVAHRQPAPAKRSPGALRLNSVRLSPVRYGPKPARVRTTHPPTWNGFCSRAYEEERILVWSIKGDGYEGLECCAAGHRRARRGRSE